jgi:hypothetical protein
VAGVQDPAVEREDANVFAAHDGLRADEVLFADGALEDGFDEFAGLEPVDERLIGAERGR